MAQGDLDIGLLLKIMNSVGESRGHGDPKFTISTGDLMNLVPAGVGTGLAALDHLDRHVDYLQEDGYLTTSPAGVYRWLRLTVKAQKFVQPELAEFGRQPMLPQVVKSLEDQIQVLTYPTEIKDGMLYRLPAGCIVSLSCSGDISLKGDSRFHPGSNGPGLGQSR